MSNKYHNTDLYVTMPYKRIVSPTGESGDNAYFAEVIELNGCYAEGSTAQEAFDNLNDSIRAYVEASKAANISIPKPIAYTKNKGKLLIRMSPTLHNQLIAKAKQSNTSLNTTVVNSIIAGMQQV